MGSVPMSDYERKAYEQLTAPPRDSRSLMPRWARDTASRTGRSIRAAASRIPGNEAVADAYAKAAKGLLRFTSSNGIHSVNLEGSIKRHQAKGHDVEQSQDFLKLDLRQCDEMLPSRRRIHEFAAVAEGAASSLLVTGATVSSTVSGGTTAAIALGTVATDSVLVMAGLGRVVGEVAVSYGFDPGLPEEEVFALQVLGFGMAVESGAKSAALASLSRLTQDMMRQATWTQLNEHLLVAVIDRAFASMGLRLTQKKLAQVVPVAGVLISSGVNLQLLHRVRSAAIQAYRLRFLTEKYDLETPFSSAVVLSVDEHGDDEDPVRIDALLAEVLLLAQQTHTDSASEEAPEDDSDDEGISRGR